MPRTPIPLSKAAARRLIVRRQHLAGPLPARATRESILSVMRDTAYIQWDPISIVAPSHLLALWARVGKFDPIELEALLWSEKRIFLHWTPLASLVLMEDFALYHALNRRYPESLSKSWGAQKVSARRFLAGHRGLRQRILRELRRGPRRTADLAEGPAPKRPKVEWNPSTDVAEMLYHLTMSGDVMVVGHDGNQNAWARARDFLPDWIDRSLFTEAEFERKAVRRGLHALGTATPTEINYHYLRGRCRHLKAVLRALERDSVVCRVHLEGQGPREERYLLTEDLPSLEVADEDSEEPRTSLLPPFDNLLYSQARGIRLFDFDYIREQFLPPEKRRFGLYVLPILRGDRLIGRLDPRLRKETQTLVINSVHAEAGAPTGRQVAEGIRDAIDALADRLGARRVAYKGSVPAGWKSALH